MTYVIAHAASTITTWRSIPFTIERSARRPRSAPTAAAVTAPMTSDAIFGDSTLGVERPRDHRQQGAEQEADEAQPGGLPRRGKLVRDQCPAPRGVYCQGFLGIAHHLVGRGAGVLGLHAVTLVHRRQLGSLGEGVVHQLPSLDGELTLNQVVLRGHTHPFAGGHADRTRPQRRPSRRAARHSNRRRLRRIRGSARRSTRARR